MGSVDSQATSRRSSGELSLRSGEDSSGEEEVFDDAMVTGASVRFVDEARRRGGEGPGGDAVDLFQAKLGELMNHVLAEVRGGVKEGLGKLGDDSMCWQR